LGCNEIGAGRKIPRALGDTAPPRRKTSFLSGLTEKEGKSLPKNRRNPYFFQKPLAIRRKIVYNIMDNAIPSETGDTI
jgi:hypothetical protein